METKNTSGKLDLTAEPAGNQLAAALGNGTTEQPFTAKNKIFETVFPGLNSPSDLYKYITNKSDNKT